MIRLCLFISLLLSGCWAFEELCKRSSEFVEKDSEIIDNVEVWLHTTPVKDSSFSSNWCSEFEHEWSLVFFFPDTERTVTHKGLVKDGEGYSCSQNAAPKERDGSTMILLGIIFGSPKMFANYAKENDKCQSYQSVQTLTFSQNWVVNMAKLIGGDIWRKMEDPRHLFIEERREEETFDWIELKCAGSLGVDLLLYSYFPFAQKGRQFVFYATYAAKYGYYGYQQYHKSTTYYLCLKTFSKLKAKYYDKNENIMTTLSYHF